MNAGELWDLVAGAVLARLYKNLSLLRLRPNMNQMTDHLWIGGRNHPHFVVHNGFDAVVDLRQNVDHKYCSFLQESGISCLRKPTPDGSGMSPRDLLDTAEWIDKKVRVGGKVLIHCDLGRGRAALVASSYLVYSGLDVEAALMFVKRARSITHLNSRQEAALQAFVRASSRRKTRALHLKV